MWENVVLSPNFKSPTYRDRNGGREGWDRRGEERKGGGEEVREGRSCEVVMKRAGQACMETNISLSPITSCLYSCQIT